jgi:tetratricopeptide (TPR) repeat protein
MFSDAEKICKETLQQQPKHFDALHFLGLIALQTNRAERSVSLIGRAIALKPDFPDAHNNRGLALLALRRRAEALISYDKAIALKPDYAEAHSNRGVALRDLRRQDEALVSYDTAIALRADFAEAHYNRAIALLDLQRHEEALVSSDRAIALKPDYAEAHSSRGIALAHLQRYQDALASHEKAIALNPSDAEAHNNRGIALQDLRCHAEALASYNNAIALRPDFAEAHYNRGNALQDLQRPAEALASYDKAIALAPGYAKAHNNRGLALQDLRRPQEALVSYDKATALDPDYTDGQWNKGLCLLQLGRFGQGWEHYEWGKKHGVRPADRPYPQPLWLGKQDIADKTLFIYWEQGLGDTLQFCRYAKLVKARGARVILSVQDPLLRLLRQMEPAIQIIGGKEEPGAFDYHCPLLSLPLAMGTTLETIPSEPRYLTAEARLRAEWAARLPPKSKPRIGLMWRGNPETKYDRTRSMELATLLPLLRDDAEWVWLQKGLDDEEAALLKQNSRIAFVGNEPKDFNDAAALIDLMDLVITVDTAMAHLAGALGKPVWVLLPYNAESRWLLDRNDSPWYPSARLFRQREIGNWGDVVDQARHELDRMIGGGAWT